MSFPLMYFLMLVQIAISQECFPTNIARVRLHASMDLFVLGQATLVGESLAAQITSWYFTAGQVKLPVIT